MTLAIQFQTFLAMLAAGSFIAIQLDVYHRLLPQRVRSKWPQAILDLGFWIVQAVLVFYVLFNMNDGELRIYIFIAILFGFWVYWLTFRPVFLQLLEGIITVVDGIYRFIRKVFLFVLMASCGMVVSRNCTSIEFYLDSTPLDCGSIK